MNQNDNGKQWPPVSGDFEVRNPERPVAVCTLGKKIHVDADYSIIGTCKTENIGIERIIINVISNPSIRFLILAGPEVPGHHTGSSLSSLYHNGIESDTRHRWIGKVANQLVVIDPDNGYVFRHANPGEFTGLDNL